MNGIKVIMNYYKIQIGYPVISKKEIKAVINCLKENRLSAGKYVKRFEKMYAQRLKRKYALATNSGSSANLIAILSMKERYNWRDNDKIIVPALTFATAVMPVIQAKLTPIFIDVDQEGNIEYNRREWGKIDAKAVVLVHSLGVFAKNTFRIRNHCKQYGIKILEDGCESHGAKYKHNEVGQTGDISTFSFFVAHNMTTGEGGMILTDDKKLYEIAKSIREFGRTIIQKRWGLNKNTGFYDSRYIFDRLGYNMRMTDIEASIGIQQLKKLDIFNQQRVRLVKYFRRKLQECSLGINTVADSDDVYNTYYAILLYCGTNRNGLINYLERRGIETRPFMGGNLLRQKVFKKYGDFRNYPTAERLHKETFLVGCHPKLTFKDMDYIVDVLKSYFQK